MNHKPLAILLVFTILMIALVDHYARPESFANRDDKAKSIYKWFAGRANPTYTSYIRDNKDSNIVEYEDILGLLQNHDFTVDSVESTL
jgi:hypothetical protein